MKWLFSDLRRRCWSSWVWWTPRGFSMDTTSSQRLTSPPSKPSSTSEVRLYKRIHLSTPKQFVKSALCLINILMWIVYFPGCTGALARELAKEYPSSSVTVFDLPLVVEAAQKHFRLEDDTVVFQSGECCLIVSESFWTRPIYCKYNKVWTKVAVSVVQEALSRGICFLAVLF